MAITPQLWSPRGFLSRLRGNQFLKLFSTSSHENELKIISIEGKRGKINELHKENDESIAPSFLPTEDFPYTYKPMSIFEEVMSKDLIYI